MKSPTCFRRIGCLTVAGLGILLHGAGCASEVDSDDPARTDESALEQDEPECRMGEGETCEISREWSEQGVFGHRNCEDNDGVPTWGACEMSGSSTPLVLVFGPAPVAFSEVASASFDVAGMSASVATDWPTADTPWLALDCNGNGKVDDGTELFGSACRLRSGERAINGFVALRELDDNGDGRVDAGDASWQRLLVWSDRDGDRASVGSELASVNAWSLVSIELGYRSERRCDERGNCEVERARFVYRDAAGNDLVGDVVDIHLKHR